MEASAGCRTSGRQKREPGRMGADDPFGPQSSSSSWRGRRSEPPASRGPLQPLREPDVDEPAHEIVRRRIGVWLERAVDGARGGVEQVVHAAGDAGGAGRRLEAVAHEGVDRGVVADVALHVQRVVVADAAGRGAIGRGALLDVAGVVHGAAGAEAAEGPHDAPQGLERRVDALEAEVELTDVEVAAAVDDGPVRLDLIEVLEEVSIEPEPEAAEALGREG